MKPSNRRFVSLLLCLALLFMAAGSPAFSTEIKKPVTNWPDYITVDKEATQPGFTSGARETVVTLDVTGNAPEIIPMLDIVLVLDKSLSMNEKEDDVTRIEALKTAAKSFTDAMLPPLTNNRIAIVSYGTRADNVIGFSSNAGTVKTAIDGINLDSYTNMHEGMLFANKRMADDARTAANKVIVFMSDGVPNRYMTGAGLTVVTGSGSDYNANAAAAFQDAAAVAKGNGITVMTIGLFHDMAPAEQLLAKGNLMAAASTKSGSTEKMFYEASVPSSLAAIYELIGIELSTLIGDQVSIHDYVPVSFDLDQTSFVAKVNGTTLGSPTITYDAGDRSITWNVGSFKEPTSGPGTLSLSYKMIARNTWYGAFLTNREDLEDNHGAFMDITLAAGLGTETVPFPDPDIRVRPYAKADGYTMDMDNVLTVPANGLLINDDVVTVNQFNNDRPDKWGFSALMVDDTPVTDPMHGDVVLHSDGSFTYTPDTGFHGMDTFEYRTYVMSWPMLQVTSLNPAPMLAAGDDFTQLGPVVEGPAPVILASDEVLVTIMVLEPEPETTTVYVQKYIVDTTTTTDGGIRAGAGFLFEVHPAYVEGYEGTPPVFDVGPTDEFGLASVALPNAIYVLVEKDLTGYTNDIPDDFSFSVLNGNLYAGDAKLDDNTIVVHNYPDNEPTPVPTTPPTPTPRPTSPPSPTNPPTPSDNVALLVEVVGPGTALPYSGPYGINSTVQLTATPDEGAIFTGWSGPDGDIVDTNNRIFMTTDRHVIANFEIPSPPATPTPTPVPVPEVVIPEPEIPEAPPEEILSEEELPQDAPVLPKTAGIPLAGLVALGVTAIGAGIWRKRKQ